MDNDTIRKLTEYSDIVEFERLCSDLLARLGYRGIEPQGVGRKDGGKDALLINFEKLKIVCHFSMRKDWKTKLREDLESVKNNKLACDKFVFVSNRLISAGEKDNLKSEVDRDYNWELDIFDNERLRVELDTNSKDLREKYLGIPKDPTIPRKIDEVHRILTQTKSKVTFEVINKVAKAIIHMKDSKEVLVNDKLPIDIKEKVSLNGLTSKFEDILKICFTKFADIDAYLKSSILKTDEINRLLLTIKAVYLESKNNGKNGDDVFMIMINKIIPEKCTDEEYQAYTTLICYFFHTCEVFESVSS
ncbi:ABC-three component system protein [Nanoarchaeota archaeon]